LVKKLGTGQIVVILLGIAGAGLLAFIIYRSNPHEILKTIVGARWRLCVVVAYHLLPLFLDAVAWHALFADRPRPRLRQLYWMRWLGESVSTMLPAMQVGGDLVRARLAVIIGGARVSASIASVLVDITLSIFTQALFTIAGLSLLAASTRRFSEGKVVAGAFVVLLALAGFYAIQRIGIFRIISSLVSRMAGEKSWQVLKHEGAALDDDTRALYNRPRSLAISGAATMASWLFGTGEVFLSLWALHLPVKYSTAFILESVGQGIEAAMFLVPGALGLQEGAYMGVGKLLGLTAQAALTLALIRRLRELSFGVPGVLTWQAIETRRAWRSRSTASAR